MKEPAESCGVGMAETNEAAGSRLVVCFTQQFEEADGETLVRLRKRRPGKKGLRRLMFYTPLFQECVSLSYNPASQRAIILNKNLRL